MTYKEAIEAIKCNYPPSNYSMLREALDLSMEILEKQIPKKPEAYYDGFYGVYPAWEYKCPCCGRDVADMEHHCECGQAIDWDWGEEDEA